MPSKEFRAKLQQAVLYFRVNAGNSLLSAKLAMEDSMRIMGATPRVSGDDPICVAITYFAANEHPPFLDATCILLDAWEWSQQSAYHRTVFGDR
jgi:hypothetical protein